MKINGTNRVGNINEYKKSLEARAHLQEGKKGKNKDQVEISSMAKELLEAQGATGTEQKREKLESLRRSVDDGTYRVDARKIADKLLPYLNQD
ncbi:flagellar biosynthesis anti-sigma factor FlgM [Paenibacillus thalictri]|uniref:Negative regulator of flagellin synthesis n=1 Tax=Paenibacillus thalictri TaxID=2527873 RepID=A0A4Q9DK52_9BACL|nr:flagellar biosynthesis anti-sigma factor FlgM [Paenibacillus thalictri]TBL72990.1 flagellar biosynthesis anti-sigma factor FlgM [Paenibacillus thalictri]